MTTIGWYETLDLIVSERLAWYIGRSDDELRACLPGDLAAIELEARKRGVPDRVIELGLRNLVQSLAVNDKRVFPQ